MKQYYFHDINDNSNSKSFEAENNLQAKLLIEHSSYLKHQYNLFKIIIDKEKGIYDLELIE